ncbi:MAG: UDP-N-acetylmuramate dehydrogenase [Campylobacterales bacterium]|nr:UDP-N-acetylmuramate dehydrogenase [Campylobacterales bacterium]
MHYKTIDFSSYSSFKMGPCIEVALLENPHENYEEYYLIGSCNNTLVGPKAPKLITLSKQFDYIKIEGNTLKIGGATPSGKVASFCKKNDIGGFEFLSHLPGKLGGLVYMNAGLKEYEIFNILLDITTPSGTKTKDEISYGYRQTDISEPILEATFTLNKGYRVEMTEMFKKMRANQPSTPSAGSCFKNPQGDYAGRLIEAVGLKGLIRGAMCFSQEHANFLVNNGGGVFEDAIWLIQEAQKRVFDEFGIWLECEIIILDERYMGSNSPLLSPKS